MQREYNRGGGNDADSLSLSLSLSFSLSLLMPGAAPVEWVEE